MRQAPPQKGEKDYLRVAPEKVDPDPNPNPNPNPVRSVEAEARAAVAATSRAKAAAEAEAARAAVAVAAAVEAAAVEAAAVEVAMEVEASRSWYARLRCESAAMAPLANTPPARCRESEARCSSLPLPSRTTRTSLPLSVRT